MRRRVAQNGRPARLTHLDPLCLLQLDEADVALVKAHGADAQLAIHLPPLALTRSQPPAVGEGLLCSSAVLADLGGAEDARGRGEGEELLVRVDVGDDGEELVGRVPGVRRSRG